MTHRRNVIGERWRSPHPAGLAQSASRACVTAPRIGANSAPAKAGLLHRRSARKMIRRPTARHKPLPKTRLFEASTRASAPPRVTTSRYCRRQQKSGTPPMGQRQGRGSRINTLPALSGGASTRSSPSTHFITSASLNSAPAFIEDTRIFCSERSISRLSAVINTAKSEAECVQLSANGTTPTWRSVPKASDGSEQRSEGPRFQMSSPRSYWPGPMKATAGQTMA